MTIIGRDRQSSADYFFLGLNALGMLNAVAIAYSRGHDLIEVTSRYTDTVLPSSIATIYFASRLVCSGVRGATTRFIAYGSYLTIFLAIIGQSYLQWSKLEERAYMLRMSTVNTAKFLNGDEEAFETNQMVTSLIPTQHNLAKAFVAVNKVLHYQLLFLVRVHSQVDTPTRRDVARLSRDRKTISRPFRLIA